MGTAQHGGGTSSHGLGCMMIVSVSFWQSRLQYHSLFLGCRACGTTWNGMKRMSWDVLYIEETSRGSPGKDNLRRRGYLRKQIALCWRQLGVSTSSIIHSFNHLFNASSPRSFPRASHHAGIQLQTSHRRTQQLPQLGRRRRVDQGVQEYRSEHAGKAGTGGSE